MKEIMQQSGMTIKEFSDYFGIPYRTVQNWSNGIREPAEWVKDLIKYKLENEKKIAESKSEC